MAKPIEDEIREVEEGLRAGARAQSGQVLHSHRWELQVMRWCMADPSLRIRVLRFMDCLPALSDPQDVVRHLREYFPEKEGRLPAALRLGVVATRPSLLTAPLVAAATRRAATAIARMFLAGATLEEAAEPLRRLQDQGFGITVDLLGEATMSQAEADRFTEQVLDLVRNWGRFFSSKIHLSLKLSSLAFPFDPIAPEAVRRQILPRTGMILPAILEQEGFLNVDMEQYHCRDLTLDGTLRLLEEQFPQTSSVGVVIQAYLKDAEPTARRLVDWAKRRGCPITLRLVRGAYWDTEVILARQLGWPCPVYTEKGETDASFDRLCAFLLESHPFIRLAVATHNVRSIAHALVQARRLGVPQDRWECQMLYGIARPLQQAVLQLGLPVRIYAPIGELIPGMGYLVRRILENTSQYSFLAEGLGHEE